MKTKPLYRPAPALVGRMFETDDENTRYRVLAISASRSTVLLLRYDWCDPRWVRTNILATCPVHRLSVDSDWIEPGPWLVEFPKFNPAQLSLAASGAAALVVEQL